MKKSYLFLIVMIVAAMTSGCNNWLGNKNVGDYDNQNSTELLKVGNPNKNYDVDENDTDEIADQNPNFLNLNTDHKTNVNNEGFALDKVRQIIGTSNQFNVGPIWRNGNDLYVRVYSARNLTGKQEQQARRQLERELTAALPTYDIHVQIGNR